MEFSEILQKISSIPGGWGMAASVFGIVFVALVFDLVQRFITYRLAKKTRGTENPWDDALFDAIRKPASLFIWMMGISFAAEIVSRHSEAVIFDYVDEVRAVVVVVVLTWFLLRFINKVERNFIEKRMKENLQFDQTAVDAIGKLLRATTVITATLMMMQTFGFSIGGILAFGGVGGIAVGFAAKDMLANFFGGMTIYLDKPFKVGDWIRSSEKEIEGTVERIGWRSTRIRTFDQRPLYVPNSVFTNIVVENPSRMFARRIFETIGVRYDDFDKLEMIVDEVREMMTSHEEIAQERTLMVNFDAFADSSLNFFVYAFTRTKVWAEYHAVKQDVLLKVGRIIEKHGAEIAFPTRTLHMPEGLLVSKAGGESVDE
ncbi:MAG: mechanosensitive ion channel family protein [Proteobacteria bacterium]|nr:mechanosensitive ion channel family protein [Pseudomonadota bacterium]